MGSSRRTAAVVAALVLVGACANGDDEGTDSGTETGTEQAVGPAETQEEAPADAPLVMATTTIWADVTANVACGGLAQVESVMPPGADSHGFEPSLADRGRLQEATLVVANGLDLEEGLVSTLASVKADGVPVFFIADHLDTIDGFHHDHGHDDDHGHGHDDDHGHGHDDDGHGHAHEGEDPHVWFDPVRVDSALDHLAAALVAEAGLDPDEVDDCLTSYRQELMAVDGEIRDIVDQLPADERLLVTNHDSFGYFADRYDFEVIGTVIPSTTTMAETNPAALEALAQAIEGAGVSAVFTEVALSAPDAAALADRVGDVEVIELYTESLGPAGSGAETYLDMLRTNARRIVDGLSAGA
jgi:zinc/manganese transport system substrate-binding protein